MGNFGAKTHANLNHIWFVCMVDQERRNIDNRLFSVRVYKDIVAVW